MDQQQVISNIYKGAVDGTENRGSQSRRHLSFKLCISNRRFLEQRLLQRPSSLPVRVRNAVLQMDFSTSRNILQIAVLFVIVLIKLLASAYEAEGIMKSI